MPRNTHLGNVVVQLSHSCEALEDTAEQPPSSAVICEKQRIEVASGRHARLRRPPVTGAYRPPYFRVKAFHIVRLASATTTDWKHCWLCPGQIGSGSYNQRMVVLEGITSIGQSLRTEQCNSKIPNNYLSYLHFPILNEGCVNFPKLS